LILHFGIQIEDFNTMAADNTGSTKSAWFDDDANMPLISAKAQQLESFITAMADGQISDAELKSQEDRVTKLLKEIEPQLDPRLHERVTELLCELTAYDMMQMLHTMQQARPATAFRG
jgi:hypothetical protein